MTKIEIILSGILFLSMGFNVFVFAYARAAIGRLLSVSEELGDLQQMIDSFAKHTKAVYEMDSFYGDQTLRFLLEHAVSLNEQLETFESIYSLTEEEYIPEEAERENYDDEEEENETA